jgi:hypothetical protein
MISDLVFGEDLCDLAVKREMKVAFYCERVFWLWDVIWEYFEKVVWLGCLDLVVMVGR